MLTDCFKVLNHTHAIIFAVPQVELPETFTWKLRTIVMVPFPHQVTPKYDAVFMALPVRCITSTAPVFFPKKSHAGRTVHAAWCNERGPERIFHRHGS